MASSNTKVYKGVQNNGESGALAAIYRRAVQRCQELRVEDSRDETRDASFRVEPEIENTAAEEITPELEDRSTGSPASVEDSGEVAEEFGENEAPKA